jgi:methylenetetrahydrofolate--tRNA-(uracil-5-)-methyltransferase
VRFAGQITGCEGYVESAAIGLLAGRFAAFERLGHVGTLPPAETALGSLLGHITGGGDPSTYQPMNVNFGLFPPLIEPASQNGKKNKRMGARDRKSALSRRALSALDAWIHAQLVA